MKNINVKSVLLGIALCAGIVLATAATNNNPEKVVAERYQLFKHQWWDGSTNPYFQDQNRKNAYLTGMFKIDTSNGQVWALTTSNPDANLVQGWVPIK
ncbi:MAG: hypothetical protein PF692_02505 [Kiritimatiellae bacterium]|nr:hypothetical protein [Kiritimatiellia bacterium]